MAEVTVKNPEVMDSKKVDGSGKLYVGNKWAGQKVTFVIEKVEEIDEKDN
jgi:hypothetical protein